MQVSKTTWNVWNCYVNLTKLEDSILQCVCSIVDHSWRQSVVRTKKKRDLDVTISASCDWSFAIFTMSLESQESYLTLRNLTLQTCLLIHQDFFHLHSTFARLYNTTASPASCLRSAGLLAIIDFRCYHCLLLWGEETFLIVFFLCFSGTWFEDFISISSKGDFQ